MAPGTYAPGRPQDDVLTARRRSEACCRAGHPVVSERDEERLEDILRAIDSILRHRPDGLTQLLDDEPLQSLINLKQIIGETAPRLP